MAKKTAPPTKKVEECGTCMYGAETARRMPRRAEAVICKRYPPQQSSMTGTPDPNPHPVVRANGWCGEYKSK